MCRDELGLVLGFGYTQSQKGRRGRIEAWLAGHGSSFHVPSYRTMIVQVGKFLVEFGPKLRKTAS